MLGDTFPGVSYGCVWESEREVHLECIFPIYFSLVTHWHRPRCDDTADLCKGMAHKHPLTWLIFREKLLSWSWRSCKHHAVLWNCCFCLHLGCAWQIVPVGRKLLGNPIENPLLGEWLKRAGWVGVNLLATGCSMTCDCSKTKKELTFYPVDMSDTDNLRQE